MTHEPEKLQEIQQNDNEIRCKDFKTECAVEKVTLKFHHTLRCMIRWADRFLKASYGHVGFQTQWVTVVDVLSMVLRVMTSLKVARGGRLTSLVTPKDKWSQYEAWVQSVWMVTCSRYVAMATLQDHVCQGISLSVNIPTSLFETAVKYH